MATANSGASGAPDDNPQTHAPDASATGLGAVDEAEQHRRLLERLLRLDHETTWVEYKHHNADPGAIGEYVSALSNSAALEGRRCGYVVWGIKDTTHEVVGTKFRPSTAKEGQEELSHYLTRQLSPQVHFEFIEFTYNGIQVAIMEIEAANQRPVAYRNTEYIRIGSYKKLLKSHVEYERRLWRLFDARSYESSPARDHLSIEDLVTLLDYPSFFRMKSLPLPENRSLIIETLQANSVISYDIATEWSITVLGALLFANTLEDFPSLSRKSVRVIEYEGNSRVETVREQLGQRGYASGFSGLIRFVRDLLPMSESIVDGIRRVNETLPELSVRELIANALIHQDLTLAGTGPLIEIFEDRLEVTNPGIPLIDPVRFIDSPPQSRNEYLGRLMRQMGVCEERGSGWDKISFEIELLQLPAPLIEVQNSHTRVVLFSARPLAEISKEDKIRAIYYHACLKWVSRQHMNNASVRERFGIEARNSATASRLIRDALQAKAIVPYDPSVGAKAMRYVPFWAGPDAGDIG